MFIVKKTVRKLKTLNIFEQTDNTDQEPSLNTHDQLIATRIYITLLATTWIAVSLFTVFTKITYFNTVGRPTLEFYMKLENDYPMTLTCTCDNSAIHYSRFLSISTKYHQICTSEFISKEWIASLFDVDKLSLTPLDFRHSAAIQFRTLAALCEKRIATVEDSKSSFLSRRLSSLRLLSSKSLAIQGDNLLDKFHKYLSSLAATVNQYLIVFNTLIASTIRTASTSYGFWLLKPGTKYYELILNRYPRVTQKGFDACTPLKMPIYEAGIYDWAAEPRSIFEMMVPSPSPIFVIPGMHVGCIPFYALIQSSLECFFSSICLNTTISLISNLDISSWPQSLTEETSQFTILDSIESIANRYFVVQWYTSINFTSYYHACNPIECSYTYSDYDSVMNSMTQIIGYYGGLSVALQKFTLILIMIMRKVQNLIKKRRVKITVGQPIYDAERGQKQLDCSMQEIETIDLNDTQLQSNSKKQSLLNKILKMLNEIKSKIRTINVFDKEFDSNAHGIVATRIYILVMISFMVTMLLHTLVADKKIFIQVLKPSRETFLKLSAIHKRNLSCPCSKVAVMHKEIIQSSTMQLHPICESHFTSAEWIDEYFIWRYPNESTRYSFQQYDMKQKILGFFSGVGSLCSIATSTTSAYMSEFMEQELLNSDVLSPLEFDIRVNSVIDAFQKQSGLLLFLFISLSRLGFATSVTEYNMYFQQLNIDEMEILRVHVTPPASIDECSCSVAYSCANVSQSLESILCKHNPYNIFDGQTCIIPGFLGSCRDIDSLMASDIHCFFNQTCINKLLFGYGPSTSNNSFSSNSIIQHSALNISRLHVSSQTATIEALLQRLMIEDWSVKPNFESYYKACAPSLCIYSIGSTSDIKYILQTIIGYFGLTIVFRLLIPVFVWLLYHILSMIRGNQLINERRRRLRQGVTSIKKDLVTINFFKEQSRQTQVDNGQRMGILSSRVYLLLLMISLIALVFSTNNGQKIIYKTVSLPSIETFESLQAKYYTTLSCPCEQISIPNHVFTDIKVIFNQVCSSDFIQDNWIRLLYGTGSRANGYSQSHRPLLSKYFQIIKWFCDWSKRIVEYSVLSFKTSPFISAFILTESLFESELTNNLQQLIQHNSAHFRREFIQLLDFLDSSLVIGGFNTDWLPVYGNESNNYIIHNIPRLFPNDGCNCAITNDCFEPLLVGPPNMSLPGLMVGCTPIRGLRISTLECFFSRECIEIIVNHFHYYTELNGSITHESVEGIYSWYRFRTLTNSSTLTTTWNDSINQLMDRFFVDDWKINRSYQHYFDYCASTACHYNYPASHDAIDIFTSLISFYGSLTIVWRFVAWRIVSIYRILRTRLA